MMRARSIALLSGIPALLLFVATWLAMAYVPPQFLPEFLYQLKFGNSYPASRAVGDGTLIDFGPRADIDRYVVDLGLIDSTIDERTFFLTRVPDETLFAGFEVKGRAADKPLLFATPNVGTCLLEVTTNSGEPVVVEDGRLSDWIWSGPLQWEDYAFVYAIGKDSGKGSVFTASSKVDYRLRVKFEWMPGMRDKYRVRVLLKGGGWRS